MILGTKDRPNRWRDGQSGWLPLWCMLSLTGCAAVHQPENADVFLYAPEKSATSDRDGLSFPLNSCPPPGSSENIQAADLKMKLGSLALRQQMRFSSGDRFNLLVPGAPEFSGDYVINADGSVILPFAPIVEAVGTTTTELASRIAATLVRAELFKEQDFRVSVRPVQYGPINVSISGAVFLTGRFVINKIEDGDKGEKALAKFGDNPVERFVAAALRAAGGIRPDADLSQIILTRQGRKTLLDWRGAMTGGPVDDLALEEGDQIHVSEAECFQAALVRPSQITPPGIRVFQSNLTVPATSNATSAIGAQSNSLPYGTRFLAGLVATNCVGGSLATNASRHGILISRNPKTQRTEVIQRSIEELVMSADRDAINPFLMPDDAIACYDSAATDAREISSLIQALIIPGSTAKSAGVW
jgi:polysaccharide biosynthesis/export protein